jgi:DNA-directed RNA polymerase subunit L
LFFYFFYFFFCGLQIAGQKDSSVTFVFKDEGHTLGNALRYMLIKHPGER